METQGIFELIKAVYIWFNVIANPANPLLYADLEKYFTPDFVMNMNGHVLTRNYKDLYQHFNKFREGGTILKINLPFEEVIVSKDNEKCVVKYTISKKDPHGALVATIKVIAIWHISPDNRLAYMNEVAVVESNK